MKVGDLVRDKDWVRPNPYGVIVEVDESEGMFKVIWNGHGSYWKVVSWKMSTSTLLSLYNTLNTSV